MKYNNNNNNNNNNNFKNKSEISCSTKTSRYKRNSKPHGNSAQEVNSKTIPRTTGMRSFCNHTFTGAYFSWRIGWRTASQSSSALLSGPQDRNDVISRTEQNINWPPDLSTSQRTSPQLSSSVYDVWSLVKATVHIMGQWGNNETRQAMYVNVKLRRVRGTVIAMEKKQELNVCLKP